MTNDLQPGQIGWVRFEPIYIKRSHLTLEQWLELGKAEDVYAKESKNWQAAWSKGKNVQR